MASVDAWTLGVAAITAAASLGGVGVKSKMDGRAERLQARISAYEELAGAAERLASRAIGRAGEMTAPATAVATIKSLAPFLTATAILAFRQLDPLKRHMSDSDAAALIGRLPPGIDPPPAVSDLELLVAFGEFSRAVTGVRLHGSETMQTTTEALDKAVRELVEAVGKPLLNDFRQQRRLQAKRAAYEKAKADFAASVRIEIGNGTRRRSRRRHRR